MASSGPARLLLLLVLLAGTARASLYFRSGQSCYRPLREDQLFKLGRRSGRLRGWPISRGLGRTPAFWGLLPPPWGARNQGLCPPDLGGWDPPLFWESLVLFPIQGSPGVWGWTSPTCAEGRLAPPPWRLAALLGEQSGCCIWGCPASFTFCESGVSQCEMRSPGDGGAHSCSLSFWGGERAPGAPLMILGLVVSSQDIPSAS